MSIKVKHLESLLTDKFHFSRSPHHSTDHRWYELHLEGVPVILTKVSHTKKEISAALEGKIARQLRVRKTFFRGMVICSNSCEDYYHQVKEDPFPPWNIHF